MHILRANILDNRFLRLIEGALKAGYCEEWTYHPSLSGSPQGGIVSPILSNIYMDRLDKFVEETLIPEYTRGRKRGLNPPYKQKASLAEYYRKKGQLEKAEDLRNLLRPSRGTPTAGNRRTHPCPSPFPTIPYNLFTCSL